MKFLTEGVTLGWYFRKSRYIVIIEIKFAKFKLYKLRLQPEFQFLFKWLFFITWLPVLEMAVKLWHGIIELNLYRPIGYPVYFGVLELEGNIIQWIGWIQGQGTWSQMWELNFCLRSLNQRQQFGKRFWQNAFHMRNETVNF